MRRSVGAGLALVTVLLMLGATVSAQEPEDDFWEDTEFEDQYISGTGSGGGPLMIGYKQDLDGVNAQLEGAGLLPIPEKTLYWGGAAWGGIATGEKFFVAIGGGGYGGDDRAEQGARVSEWSHGAGYFAIKGIYALDRRLFVEGGIQLGGGSSHVVVEDQAANGVIEVHVRGDRNFLLLRPHVGFDLRLARWVGILFEAGYSLTSGDWRLEGESDLISQLDFDDGNAPYFGVMVRIGI